MAAAAAVASHQIPRAHHAAALGVGLLCVAVYAALLAAGPFWLDSAEFAAAAFDLGVAHPPGHPLVSLVGKAFALLPLGPVAMRVGLSQAVCGALAAALVTLLGAALARRALVALSDDDATEGWPWLEAACGAAAGLGFGLSHAATLSAVRPEVYALNAALGLYAVLELCRFDEDGDARRPLRAALALGLALCNHHFLTVLLGGAVALYVAVQHQRWRRDRGGARFLGGLALAGLLGLCCYAYLPLRALRHPEVDWGAPSSLERFLWTVSARAFQKSLSHATLGGAPEVAAALGEELVVLWPLALVGVGLLCALAPLRRLGLLVLFGVLLVAAGPALVGFDAQNPDAYGYLEPAVALLCAAAAVPLPALVGWRRRVAGRELGAAPRLALAGVLLVAAGLPPALRLPRLSLVRFDDAAHVAGAMLEETPPRGLLVSSYFQTVFPLWYARIVEGARPDVDHVHRHFLAWPGYRDELVLRRPELAPLLGPRDVLPEALLGAAAGRRIRLEYDVDLDDALVRKLVPGQLLDGLFVGAPGDADELSRRHVFALGGRLDLGQPETLRFVFWRAFLEAHRDCRRGERRAAQAALATARALLGGARDPDLEELATRCADVPPGPR